MNKLLAVVCFIVAGTWVSVGFYITLKLPEPIVGIPIIVAGMIGFLVYGLILWDEEKSK